jgi:hypothetical protein
VKRLRVEQPFDHTKDDHRDRPKGADQVRGIARALALSPDPAV